MAHPHGQEDDACCVLAWRYRKCDEHGLAVSITNVSPLWGALPAPERRGGRDNKRHHELFNPERNLLFTACRYPYKCSRPQYQRNTIGGDVGACVCLVRRPTSLRGDMTLHTLVRHQTHLQSCALRYAPRGSAS